MSGERLSRFFVAVPFSDDLRASLLAFLEENGGCSIPGRRVAAADWHVTLRFLGRTDPVSVDCFVDYLTERAGGGSFTLGFDGLGAFPHCSRATVAWLAIRDDDGRLSELAALCEEAALASGHDAEDRVFLPHLTLGRIRPPKSISAIAEELPPFPGKLEVERIVLYERIFRSAPNRYIGKEEFLL